MDACENPLSDATVLVQIAEAARKDPATLQPALVALQAEAPHLLLRVQANQAAFLALIQGEQRTPPSATADAVPHSTTVPQPAPEAKHAAPAPVVTEAPVSSEEAPPGLAVTIVHKGTPHALQIDLEESVEVLRFQVFSLTDVPPNEQHISGLGPGVLRDGADLRTLGIVPGTWAMLARTPAAAPVASAPAPTTDAAAAVAAAAAAAAAGSAQGRARMEGRLISGLETARGHADPLKQAAARAVVPWARLCATAAAARADSVGDAAVGGAAVGDAAVGGAAVGGVAAGGAADEAGAAGEVRAAEMCETQAETQGTPPPGAAELGELLRWFKRDFFVWVDKPHCEVQSLTFRTLRTHLTHRAHRTHRTHRTHRS